MNAAVGWVSTVPAAEQQEAKQRLLSIVLDAVRTTSVLCCTWRESEDGPDFLEVDLSNGRLLRVYWDSVYSCRRLTVDSVDVTPSETGLAAAVVDGLVSEVYDRMALDRSEVA